MKLFFIMTCNFADEIEKYISYFYTTYKYVLGIHGLQNQSIKGSRKKLTILLRSQNFDWTAIFALESCQDIFVIIY